MHHEEEEQEWADWHEVTEQPQNLLLFLWDQKPFMICSKNRSRFTWFRSVDWNHNNNNYMFYWFCCRYSSLSEPSSQRSGWRWRGFNVLLKSTSAGGNLTASPCPAGWLNYDEKHQQTEVHDECVGALWGPESHHRPEISSPELQLVQIYQWTTSSFVGAETTSELTARFYGEKLSNHDSKRL